MAHAAVGSESDANSTRETTLKRYAGYTVCDLLGQKVGCAEEVFVNRGSEPEYIRVRIGFFGTRSVLIPVQFVETNEQQRTLALR